MILIVEDNAIFRTSLGDILRKNFPEIRIDEAADVHEALQKVEEITPDLIFMDIRLPGTNGLELTKTIKENDEDIIVAILTSYDLPEYRDAAFRSGANYFLTKGITSSHEIKALVEFVASSTKIAGKNHECSATAKSYSEYEV